MRFILFVMGFAATAWAVTPVSVRHDRVSKNTLLMFSKPDAREKWIREVGVAGYQEVLSNPNTLVCFDHKLESLHSAAARSFLELPQRVQKDLVQIYSAEAQRRFEKALLLPVPERVSALDDVAFAFRHRPAGRTALLQLIHYWLENGEENTASVYADTLLEDDPVGPLSPENLYLALKTYSISREPEKFKAVSEELRKRAKEIRIAGETIPVEEALRRLPAPRSLEEQKAAALFRLSLGSGVERDLFRRLLRIMPMKTRELIVNRLPPPQFGDDDSLLCKTVTIWADIDSRDKQRVDSALWAIRSVKSAVGEMDLPHVPFDKAALTYAQWLEDLSGSVELATTDSVFQWFNENVHQVKPVLPHLAHAAHNPSFVSQVRNIVAKLGPDAVGPLQDLLLSGNPFQKRGAASCLIEFGPESIPALVEAFRRAKIEKNLPLMAAIAETLSDFGIAAQEAVPLFAQAVELPECQKEGAVPECEKLVELLGKFEGLAVSQLEKFIQKKHLKRAAFLGLYRAGKYALPTKIRLVSAGEMEEGQVEGTVFGYKKISFPLLLEALEKDEKGWKSIARMAGVIDPFHPRLHEPILRLFEGGNFEFRTQEILERWLDSYDRAQLLMHHESEIVRANAFCALAKRPKFFARLFSTGKDLLKDRGVDNYPGQSSVDRAGQILRCTAVAPRQEWEVRREFIPFLDHRSSDYRELAATILLGGQPPYLRWTDSWLPILRASVHGDFAPALSVSEDLIHLSASPACRLFRQIGQQAKPVLPKIAVQLIATDAPNAITAVEAYLAIAGPKKAAAEFHRMWPAMGINARQTVLSNLAQLEGEPALLLLEDWITHLAGEKAPETVKLIASAMSKNVPLAFPKLHALLKTSGDGAIQVTPYFGKEFVPDLHHIWKNSRDASFRSQALVALVAIEKTGALPILKEALTSPIPAIQTSACSAVRAVGADAEPLFSLVVPLAVKNADQCPEALVSMGEKVVPKLRNLLDDPDFMVRHTVAMAVGFMGKQGAVLIPDLRKRLWDPAPWVRHSALYSIGQIERSL